MPVISNNKGSRWVPNSHGNGVNVPGGGQRNEKQQEIAYMRTIEGLARLYGQSLNGLDKDGLGVTRENFEEGIRRASERYSESPDQMTQSVLSYYEFVTTPQENK